MTLHRVLMLCALVSGPAAAATPPLAGLWSFEDDGTAVEFAPGGGAACATVRYGARLGADAGVLKLVVSAMGGIVNETYRLLAVDGALDACKA